MEEAPLGMERGPDSEGGRGPKGRPLNPLPPAWGAGCASHPEDQSRDLECRDGRMRVRMGTGSLGSVGSPTPSSLCRAMCWRAGQGKAGQKPTLLCELVKPLLTPFLLGLLVF